MLYIQRPLQSGILQIILLYAQKLHFVLPKFENKASCQFNNFNSIQNLLQIFSTRRNNNDILGKNVLIIQPNCQSYKQQKNVVTYKRCAAAAVFHLP